MKPWACSIPVIFKCTCIVYSCYLVSISSVVAILISYMYTVWQAVKKEIFKIFPLCGKTALGLVWQVLFLVALSFLGCVDKIGIAFEAPTISTGFGAYLAQVRISALAMRVLHHEVHVKYCQPNWKKFCGLTVA